MPRKKCNTLRKQYEYEESSSLVTRVHSNARQISNDRHPCEECLKNFSSYEKILGVIDFENEPDQERYVQDDDSIDVASSNSDDESYDNIEFQNKTKPFTKMINNLPILEELISKLLRTLSEDDVKSEQLCVECLCEKSERCESSPDNSEVSSEYHKLSLDMNRMNLLASRIYDLFRRDFVQNKTLQETMICKSTNTSRDCSPKSQTYKNLFNNDNGVEAKVLDLQQQKEIDKKHETSEQDKRKFRVSCAINAYEKLAKDAKTAKTCLKNFKTKQISDQTDANRQKKICTELCKVVSSIQEKPAVQEIKEKRIIKLCLRHKESEETSDKKKSSMSMQIPALKQAVLARDENQRLNVSTQTPEVLELKDIKESKTQEKHIQTINQDTIRGKDQGVQVNSETINAERIQSTAVQTEKMENEIDDLHIGMVKLITETVDKIAQTPEVLELKDIKEIKTQEKHIQTLNQGIMRGKDQGVQANISEEINTEKVQSTAVQTEKMENEIDDLHIGMVKLITETVNNIVQTPEPEIKKDVQRKADRAKTAATQTDSSIEDEAMLKERKSKESRYNTKPKDVESESKTEPKDTQSKEVKLIIEDIKAKDQKSEPTPKDTTSKEVEPKIEDIKAKDKKSESTPKDKPSKEVKPIKKKVQDKEKSKEKLSIVYSPPIFDFDPKNFSTDKIAHAPPKPKNEEEEKKAKAQSRLQNRKCTIIKGKTEVEDNKTLQMSKNYFCKVWKKYYSDDDDGDFEVTESEVLLFVEKVKHINDIMESNQRKRQGLPEKTEFIPIYLHPLVNEDGYDIRFLKPE